MLDGSSAPLICLVAHGNAHLLRGRALDDFFPNNSVFAFWGNRLLIREPAADPPRDPLAWLRAAKERGVRYLMLRRAPLPIRWVISIHRDLGEPACVAWEATPPGTPASREIRAVTLDVGAPGPPPTLADCKAALRSALEAIRAFGLRYGGPGPNFEPALRSLESTEPRILHPGIAFNPPIDARHLVPADQYPVECFQLLSSCFSSRLTFAGMGAWGDWPMASEADEAECWDVASALLAAQFQAVDAAVNHLAHEALRSTGHRGTP